MRFLVTAGNTREKIDQVRDWGNVFTGNTGFDIARALARHGAVDLLTSNRVHLAEIDRGLGLAHPVSGRGFSSHAELKELLAALMERQTYHAVFMAAAVADYRPERVFAVMERKPMTGGQEAWVVRDVQEGKIKSSHGRIAILGEQTEKLVDLFRKEWKHKGLLFKFKLEVGITPDELIRIGRASRMTSGADYLVANTLEMVGGLNPGAYILSSSGQEWVGRGKLAERLADLAAAALPERVG